MDSNPVTAPRRRFAGRRPPGGPRQDGLAALAETLLSDPGPAAAVAAAVVDAPPADPPDLDAAVAAPADPLAADLATTLQNVDPGAPAADSTSDAAPPDISAAPVNLPQGLYVLVAAGIEPEARRRTALAAACRLAPHARPTAVFVFEQGQADVHILGEVACGRMGPQHFLSAADPGRLTEALRHQCDQVGVILLDPPNGRLPDLARAASRAVFLATPDAESIIETYREMKLWQAGGTRAEASLYVVDTPSRQEADRCHERLREAAGRFLGWDVDLLGYLAASPTHATEMPEPLRVLSQAPAEDVWPRLLALAADAPAARGTAGLPGRGPDTGTRPDTAPAVAHGESSSSPIPQTACTADPFPARGTAGLPSRGSPDRTPAIVPDPFASSPARYTPTAPVPYYEQFPMPGGQGGAAVRPIFTLWTDAEWSALLETLESESPGRLAPSLRQVFRVDVDEPDAPPLAGVRDDGALVAILLREGDAMVDTAAAERWLAVHRSLLARAYPGAGITAETSPAAIVLAAMRPAPSTDGTRRFLPIKMGGHRGVVFLP